MKGVFGEIIVGLANIFGFGADDHSEILKAVAVFSGVLMFFFLWFVLRQKRQRMLRNEFEKRTGVILKKSRTEMLVIPALGSVLTISVIWLCA